MLSMAVATLAVRQERVNKTGISACAAASNHA
jgi:hypothetical protein